MEDIKRITLKTQASKGYELLDSGLEEKLERFGDFVLARPDPQALWEKHLPQSAWDAAHGTYERTKGEGSLPAGRQGKWRTSKDLPQEWPIEIGGLTMRIKPTSFKHTGVFPEQASNWAWLRETIEKARAKGKEKVSMLNLFGYTGGATIAAAQAGADVCHVDASKSAVAWARENAELSGVADKPIRWIIEDALTFVEREIKRGNRYDLILMDPPAFGHGPKDELWKFEEHFLPLMRLCGELLSDAPVGMLINGYAAGYSASAFAYNLEAFAEKFGGVLECGELTIEETAQKRLLPCGIFARWSSVE